MIAETRRTIEEYKALRQSIITETVTHGVRKTAPMTESGVDWIGKIPLGWKVYRIANLYEERTENGLSELPILTVSINTGVSDCEIADEDKDRVFVRSEDRTKYKRVYPGDLTYNMMRAWQGAFGAVRVDGMVSPAYVVAKPKPNVNIDSRYIEALLRTPTATEEMHRYSRGIVDFRLRLYWPEFKNIQICLPPFDEQREIADYIDNKAKEIDKIISQKQQFIHEVETYKKSVIYEYVTGKKEVPAEKQEILTVNPILLKALLYAKAQETLGKNCRGRIQIQKILFMIECMYDTRIGSQFVRQKFGPLDVELDKVEAFLKEQKWLKVIHRSTTSYQKMENHKAYHEAYEKHFGQMNQEIERLIHYFENMRSSQAERFATLMAAWNDFLLDGNSSPTDDELIQEVRTNWHSHKGNFKIETWQDTLQKMRTQHFEPHGYVSHTTMPE